MNVGVHIGSFAWCSWGDGHIDPDDQTKLKRLRAAGVRSAKYLLHTPGQAKQTQFRDIEKLRQDWQYDEVVLRLMHDQRYLPSPQYTLDWYRERIQRAFDVGLRVILQPVNEPDLELDMAPAEVTQWFAEFAAIARQAFPAAKLVSPPIAGVEHAGSWAWWDGTRGCYDVADYGGIHIYTAGRLDGAYSLPWWLGQMPGDKPLLVLECGSPNGTDVGTRAAALPGLYSQLAREGRVQGFYPFMLSGEDYRHAEHFLTEQNIITLCQLAQGLQPAIPTPPPVVPPAVPPSTPPSVPLEPSIPVGGTMRFEVTVRRIE